MRPGLSCGSLSLPLRGVAPSPSPNPCCWASSHKPVAARVKTANTMLPTSTTAPSWLLLDAHCHAQDDTNSSVLDVESASIAVMGTREDDWNAVLALQRQAPDKVIPCFGVHPWFAHQHASDIASTASDVLKPPHNQDASKLVPNPLSVTWQATLRQLLIDHPNAIVGEFGLDRVAVLPGTKAQVRLEHQLSLVRQQIALAVEFQRPVSLHCVRGYGALHDLLRDLPPEHWPPRVMLHSYGGSPEVVQSMLRLPNGMGQRLYFSFSSIIGAKGPSNKLLERLRAVPENRLLLESDQGSASQIDKGLEHIVTVVAEARGCSKEHAAHAALATFCDFYEGFLPRGAQRAAAEARTLLANRAVPV